MSIIRVGLSQTKKYAEGFDAIFGKKKPGKAKKSASVKRRTGGKKKTKKK